MLDHLLSRLPRGLIPILVPIFGTGLLACKTANPAASVKETRDAGRPPITGVPFNDSAYYRYGDPLPELLKNTIEGNHGMVVFGDQTLYFYHLPMWVAPHQFQLVLEVDFPDGDSLYRTAREQSQNNQGLNKNLVTIQPVEDFPLSKLAEADDRFSGLIFNGHFEHDGKAEPDPNNPTRVQARIKRFHAINPLNIIGEQRSRPIYRVFGHGSEWYAVHLAARKPDFDQILAIEPQASSLPNGATDPDLAVTLPDQSNSAAGRPKAGATLNAQIKDGGNLPFNVKSEVYFSELDLGPDSQ